jgi:hypothetical protein
MIPIESSPLKYKEAPSDGVVPGGGGGGGLGAVLSSTILLVELFHITYSMSVEVMKP